MFLQYNVATYSMLVQSVAAPSNHHIFILSCYCGIPFTTTTTLILWWWNWIALNFTNIKCRTKYFLSKITICLCQCWRKHGNIRLLLLFVCLLMPIIVEVIYVLFEHVVVIIIIAFFLIRTKLKWWFWPCKNKLLNCFGSNGQISRSIMNG